jgi:hypothetical protein
LFDYVVVVVVVLLLLLLLFKFSIADYCQRWTPAEILVDGVICATIASYPANDEPEHMAITCPSVMTGRVVRYHKTGGECCLNLCEFQIYGNNLNLLRSL